MHEQRQGLKETLTLHDCLLYCLKPLSFKDVSCSVSVSLPIIGLHSSGTHVWNIFRPHLSDPITMGSYTYINLEGSNHANSQTCVHRHEVF